MHIDVIILSNSSSVVKYQLTKTTISTLMKSKGDNDINVIVVESVDRNTFYGAGMDYPECSMVFPEKPFNYNQFLNIGLSHCVRDWILICNNDLIFSEGWLVNMIAAVDTNPHILSFSPKSPTWHLHQDLPECGIIEGYQVASQICGWCILLYHPIISKCGLFDERFKFWYQDNDYAMSLYTNGIKHSLVCDSIVDHIGGSSHDLFGDQLHNFTDDQALVFLDKWKQWFN